MVFRERKARDAAPNLRQNAHVELYVRRVDAE